MACLIPRENSLFAARRLHGVRVSVHRHDRLLQVVLNEGQRLATRREVEIHVWLLAEDSFERGGLVAANEIVPDVCKQLLFILIQVVQLLFVLVGGGDARFGDRVLVLLDCRVVH